MATSSKNGAPMCGIYAIEHLHSGTKYIGASRHIQKRWRTHKAQLRRNTHHCHRLQAAWNLHGPRAFSFSVLEWCAPQELRYKEAHYQQCYPPLYNTFQLSPLIRRQTLVRFIYEVALGTMTRQAFEQLHALTPHALTPYVDGQNILTTQGYLLLDNII